ncbi:MAG TPA: hypothetical protein VEH04_10230 [Verrucomicrobiae bacterium]|nr:hypothetical protein [Verrucomicrobiae bacterium]
MKKPNFGKWAALAVIGAALTLAGSNASAAETVNKYPFDTDINGWHIGWGGQGQVLWDGAQDAGGNPSSGALHITANGTAGDQLVALGHFSGSAWWNPGSARVDLTEYTNITFDIKWDAATSTVELPTYNSTGEALQFWGIPVENGAQNTPPWITIANAPIPAAASNGWTRVSVPIDPFTANIDAVYGVGFKKYTAANLTGTAAFWIDNIVLQAKQVATPPPSFTKAFGSPVSGLNLFSSPGGGEFQRTSVKVSNQSGLGFTDQPGDVTYAFTIKEFPSPTVYTNYQAHIFLTTGPGTASALDFNEADLIWLNVQPNTNGGGTAYFRYKINEPNSNTNLFGAEFTGGDAWAGQLTNLVAATPVGTWSMTFNQNTNVTLRGPGGVSVAFTIRPEIATRFIDPLNLVFGAQPNRVSEEQPQFNVGQKVVLSNAGMTNNGVAVVWDNFLDDAVLDTNVWTRLTGSPNTAFVIPNDPGQKLVQWSLPDTGFVLRTATNIAGPWMNVTPVASWAAGAFRNTVVPSSQLSSSQSFFRLEKPVFTQLQVLLPGETAAPGTPTGKTGTPDPVSLSGGGVIDITVRAVDANFNLVPSASDEVAITSTDGTAINPLNANLSNGSATFQLLFGSPGEFTITATDVTDGSKTAGVSAPVTVTP